jgi:UDP-N-acetylglucosamine--N-acetylmuramyl-(pentapeptide) pyrophosphoryl-undecaprenol N-acetylglucosamine transferase
MKKRILFVGGGTAGHIAPLLAVMAATEVEAKKRACTIEMVYIGTEQDIVSPLIKNSQLTFKKYPISAGKLHRFVTFDQFRQAGRVVKGLFEAKSLIKRLKPDVVFAKGGYVTVPVVRAAAQKKIPVFCHETDVLPGLANRIIAKQATTIFTTYPIAAYTTLPTEKLLPVGQPVRLEYYAEPPAHFTLGERAFSKDLPIVTIIGGSQGALRVNQLVAEAWPELLKKAQLVHIVGPAHLDIYKKKAKNLSEKLQKNLWIEGFVEHTAPLFRLSTLVVTRAGGTIAELAATRKPAILIPLPTAAQDHQRANARLLQSAGAAVVLEETTLSSMELTTSILKLVTDSKKQKELSEAISQFDHPGAATVMAGRILDAIC